MKPSTAIRVIVLAACAAHGAGALATDKPKSTVAYYGNFGTDVAYLVDWNTSKLSAHVVDGFLGASNGTYTDDGTQRIVTLKTPLSNTYASYDACGLPVQETDTTTQIVFRASGAKRQGTAQIVEIGTSTIVGGCAPGTVSFGSATDPGVTTDRLDMTLRASTADIVDGTELAGLTETPLAGTTDNSLIVQGSAYYYGYLLQFLDADQEPTYPIQLVNGWYVQTMPDGTQQAYTRLTKDAATGIEYWLMGAWANGAATSVVCRYVTEIDGTGGWASRAAAAHQWFEASFAGSDPLPYFDLYTDGTGLFLQDFSDGTVAQMSADWTFAGANIEILRSDDFSLGYRQRTWVPLSNHGSNHFVLEHEDNYDAGGNYLGNLFPARVNFYTDQGKATKPRKPSAAHAAPAVQRRTPD